MKTQKTLWDLGYRWTQADIELVNPRQPFLRRTINWCDLDLAPEFPVLCDALAHLDLGNEWEISSVQVASYDIAAQQGPAAQLLQNHLQ